VYSSRVFSSLRRLRPAVNQQANGRRSRADRASNNTVCPAQPPKGLTARGRRGKSCLRPQVAHKHHERVEDNPAQAPEVRSAQHQQQQGSWCPWGRFSMQEAGTSAQALTRWLRWGLKTSYSPKRLQPKHLSIATCAGCDHWRLLCWRAGLGAVKKSRNLNIEGVQSLGGAAGGEPAYQRRHTNYMMKGFDCLGDYEGADLPDPHVNSLEGLNTTINRTLEVPRWERRGIRSP